MRMIRNEGTHRCHRIKPDVTPLQALCGYVADGSDKLVNGTGADGEGIVCGSCMRVARRQRLGYKRNGERRGAGRGR